MPEQTTVRQLLEQARRLARREAPQEHTPPPAGAATPDDDTTSRYTVADDVTERQRMGRALRATRDRAQQVLDMAGVILVVIGRDERVEMINAPGLEILQCREDEVVGANWFDRFVPPWDRRRVRNLIGNLLDPDAKEASSARNRGSTNENAIRTAAGEERLIAWTNAVLRDADGQPTAVLSSGLDVTEARRAERLLHALNRASSAMQEALTFDEVYAAASRELDALGVACIVSQLDETGHRLLVSHHRLPARILDALEELAGMTLDGFRMDVDRSPALHRAVVERETVFLPNALEMIRQVLPAQLGWLASRVVRMLQISRLVIAPLIMADRVVGVMTMNAQFLDKSDLASVTAFANQVASAWRKAELMADLERRGEQLARTQAELAQSQKMDALGRLAGGIAHDFNNILTVMTGYSQMVMMSIDPASPVQIDLQHIREAGQQAADLTRQLLAFSRQQPLNVCLVNLNETLEPMARLLRPLLGEGIELVVDLSPEPLPVEADPAQLNQVVMNLAINARDAMPRGGRLRIVTRAAESVPPASPLFEIKPGPCVRLSVSDTGCGIDPKTRERLFEPFFTTKPEGMGTGMGLSTVYGIVRQSGGSIVVQSEVGVGTTFDVYLPRVFRQETTRAKVASPVPRGRGETILVIEDEETVRALTTRVIEGLGYRVLQAANGIEAVQAYGHWEERIDLLLVDVVMPGMGGPDCVDAIKAQRDDFGVLYMSGYTDDALGEYGVLQDGTRLLRKPFDLDTLPHMLREAIEARG